MLAYDYFWPNTLDRNVFRVLESRRDALHLERVPVSSSCPESPMMVNPNILSDSPVRPLSHPMAKFCIWYPCSLGTIRYNHLLRLSASCKCLPIAVGCCASWSMYCFAWASMSYVFRCISVSLSSNE